MLRSFGRRFSENARRRRGEAFLKRLNPKPTDRILDLGGGDGSHLRMILPEHRNVVVADILEEDLKRAREVYGYETVQLKDTDFYRLPFADKEFDIVFTSSVIEHVTGPKDEMIALDSNAEFRARAWEAQRRFAAEVDRIGRKCWVQTPYRFFPVECHSWMPIVIEDLPRPWQRGLLKAVAPIWPAEVQPDWHLLSIRQMRELFPGAEIERENAFGFLKSITAVRA